MDPKLTIFCNSGGYALVGGANNMLVHMNKLGMLKGHGISIFHVNKKFLTVPTNKLCNHSGSNPPFPFSKNHGCIIRVKDQFGINSQISIYCNAN